MAEVAARLQRTRDMLRGFSATEFIVEAEETRVAHWRTLHAAVFRENDKTALEKRVHDAEGAIYERLQELAREESASRETRQLKIAIKELLIIKTTKLGWPDPLGLDYDVFSGDPKDSPVWIAKVRGIGTAYERMKQPAAGKPGRYLFDPRSSQIITRVDTTNQNNE